MKKIFLISIFLLGVFIINDSFSYFWPREIEELKKQYEYIKSLRTPLSDEDKKIIEDYEIYLELEKENQKIYEENIKKNPDSYKWNMSWEEQVKRIIKSEPKLEKIFNENPGIKFYEAFELFKKENPELLEDDKKIETRASCWTFRNSCPATRRWLAVKYALEWTSNIIEWEKRKRNPKYYDYWTFDCTNFVSQALEAWFRPYITKFWNWDKNNYKNWFFKKWKFKESESWRTVEWLRHNFQENSSTFNKVESIEDLDEWDIIFMNREWWKFDHTVIITWIWRRWWNWWNTKVSYHWNDSKDIFWWDVLWRLERDWLLNWLENEYWKVNYDNF